MKTPLLPARPRLASAARALSIALSIALLSLLAPSHPARAQELPQLHIPGPPGSGEFGWVTVLPNGNFVVSDPLYDEGNAYDVGAVYLYDGATLEILSTLKGSTTGDRVGSNTWPQRGVTVLANGNFVVRSPYWNEGRGAVTWGSATEGVGGVVSAANSLVGGTAHDGVGYLDVTALPNGAYVACIPGWDNGAAEDAGAVTWSGGAPGLSGTVSAENSLVGSTAFDWIGNSLPLFLDGCVTVLANGNYVVTSPLWDNGAAADAGAVTWGSAAGGVRGAVSAANSLVGTTTDDRAGSPSDGIRAVTALPNGNYVVVSRNWDNGAAVDAGAATWGDGATGVSGAISPANSLVGSAAFDFVGGYAVNGNVLVLANGTYVVVSGYWHDMRGAVTWVNGQTGTNGEVTAANSLVGSAPGDAANGAITVSALANGNYVVAMPEWKGRRGAVTWGSGATGVSGPISAANSLVGDLPQDRVGSHSIALLANGNYVAASPHWNGGRGAATWADGATGIKGSISAANSLVGSAETDSAGVMAVPLVNGNYAVVSSEWNGKRGAVTWADGATGVRGTISAANSLVGSTPGDQIGTWVTPLANGNYVVGSPYWGGDRGAATWADGASGGFGEVSTANSLVGSVPGDNVGYPIGLASGNYLVKAESFNQDRGSLTWGDGATGVIGEVSAANSLVGRYMDGVAAEVTELANGNYVVTTPYWNGQRGAITWGSGVSGVSGEISAANSLVGSSEYDRIGWSASTAANFSQLIVLPDGNYVVGSPGWDREGIVDAGAFTWGDGTTGVRGSISTVNSVLGEAANGGGRMHAAVNAMHKLLIVGRPADNTVTVVPLEFGRMLLTLVARMEQ